MGCARLFAAVLILLACSCGTRTEMEPPALPDFNAMWDFGDPGATEARFRGLVPLAEDSGDSAYHIELLTQIARAEGLQRRFQDAHATLDTAYAMISNQETVPMARYLLERGRVYNSSGETDAAREYFLKAYRLADRLGADFYSIDALHMMGIVEPPERQLEWSMRALSLAEGSGDERARKWRGALYNNIGWTFHDLGDYEKALEMFKRSLAFRIEMDDTAGMMIAGWTIARTERSLGQVEEALDLQLGLARDLEKYGLPEDGYVYEEIAECLLLLDRKEESKEYFGRAYAILSKDDWMVANEPDRLARLNDLSR